MDIGALSMVMNQTRVQQSVGIEVMKMAMNTGKDNVTQPFGLLKHNLPGETGFIVLVCYYYSFQ